MRTRRTPFYGGPEDRHILGLDEAQPVVAEVVAEFPATKPLDDTPFELPLGYHQHDGENRQKRRAEVATWQPPKLEGEQPPTRRELVRQRKAQRLGKLDPELRRLQRRKAAK